MAETNRKQTRQNEPTAKPKDTGPSRGGDGSASDDGETDMDLDRLRALAQHEPQDPRTLEKEIFALDASTEEEVDALKVNLFQEDERRRDRDGSGRVVDEAAEEQLARFTEVGPQAGERGVESVTPGRDDTSRRLRRHHPNTEIARAEDVVEGNLDEPREEIRGERKVDEGTAA